MLKLNFAQRITVRTVKTNSGNNFASERAKVNSEINAKETKLNIDRECFKKSEHDKRELKIEKAHWKKTLTPDEKKYWKVA
jgi:hypothetical protein